MVSNMMFILNFKTLRHDGESVGEVREALV